MKKILKNIRTLRELKGYSQDYMADLLEITQSAYARFERGATKTDLETVSLVAKVFEMELIDLFTYPEKFVNIKDIAKETAIQEPEVIVQIKVSGDKKSEILKTVFESSELKLLNFS